jgi:hypothetical protein
VLWTLPGRASKWYEVGTQLQRAAEDVASLACAHDVYYGVCLQEKQTKRGRGSAESVCYVPAAWADIDVGGGGRVNGKGRFPSKAVAREFLSGLPVKPTIIVDSGHGLHAYWQLREPLVIASPEDREYAAALLNGWQAFVQSAARARGYSVDSTADLARVLRVPGSMNRKGEPLPVKVLLADGPTVNASELLEHVPAASVTSPTQPSIVGDITLDLDAEPPGMKLAALLENDRQFKRTWNRVRRDMPDQSASAYDMALADAAVASGWSDQEVCSLLVGFRRKWGENLKRPDYYTTTIAKARAAVPPAVDAESTLPLLEQLRALLKISGFEVVSTVRRGRAWCVGATYDLILHRVGGGEGEHIEVPLGDATSLLLFRRASAAIFDATNGEVLPASMARDWRKIAHLIAAAATVIETTTDAEETAGWIEMFLDHNDTYYRNASLEDVFTSDADAFCDETGRRYLRLLPLRLFLAFRLHVPIGEKKLIERLSRAGWSKYERQRRIEGRMRKAHLWVQPEGK